MKRALGLYIPFLSTDRLRSVRDRAAGGIPACAGTLAWPWREPEGTCSRRREHVTLDAAPVATSASQGGTLKIVHANRAACNLRIRPGQTLADAKAMVPGLVTYNDDAAADRRQLETLAVWADRLSPIVHIEGDDTLILDVTGCERLFGGEENLLRRAIEGLGAYGFTVRGAIADTTGAVWALAHAHPESVFISQPGRVAADLAPLPVWSLRIEAPITKALASVGVETVASLLHLPRASLASRFDESLLEHLDQALGDLPEVLTPYRPQAVLSSRIHFGAPTTRSDVLIEGVRRALERFCERLSRQVVGVRQMFVTFYCPDIVTEQGTETRSVTLPVNLAQPTRSARHLGALLAVLLERLSLPAPADALTLWARELDPLDDWQEELFTTDSSDARQLGNLLDRLAVRLGRQAVVRAELVSDHQPERAFRYIECRNPYRPDARKPQQRRRDKGAADEYRIMNSEEVSVFPHSLRLRRTIRQSAISTTGPRPLRLSPRPIEIAATSIVPEGPPIAFCFQGRRYAVRETVGPERIETGWWRGPHVKRDYYRITTQSGRRCWLFRDRESDRWFLHGWFD